MITDTIVYSLKMIQEEVRELVARGIISRQQHLYTLCQYIPPREWTYVESELEKSEFLLRDRIGELISTEIWSND
ncbi:MAG: DUF4327 family protein [Gloeocapsa sp. DLM2.Bin57]|nr:MAG: DUF4327 family protein [Gloeocapsa sp. DLM2.Bin57]